MNKFSSVIVLLLASAAAANGAHDVMVRPRMARIVNAVQKTEPAEDVPCLTEIKDMFECMGQPCIDCFLDIVKDFDNSTTCESLAADEGFCPTVEGCVKTCGEADCTSSEKEVEDCAAKNYPDTASDDKCEDLCEESEEAAVLESDSQQQGAAAVASGFRGAVSSSAGSQTLTVRVEKATDLEGEDTFGTSDVYVIVKVYKKKWGFDEKIGEQQTKVVESLNPVYNQDFMFPIEDPDDYYVELEVWDEDPGSDDEMGDAKIDLDDYNLSSTPTQVNKVVDHHITSAHSKIYVSLKVE